MQRVKRATIDLSEETAALINSLPLTLLLVDPDFRVMFAGGRQLAAEGYDPTVFVGKKLTEVFWEEGSAIFNDGYRNAFAGETSEIDYSSPVGGGRYRVQISPFRNRRGKIIAALCVTTDHSELSNREFEISQIRQLIRFGSGAYERRLGWRSDPEVLEIWGLPRLGDTESLLKKIVIPSDRGRAEALWNELRTHGGSGTLDYSIRQGGDGALRNIHGTWEATLGADGELVRVETTQVDVTEFLTSRSELAAALVEATQAREQLLRRVGAVLAHTASSMEACLQATYELAITAFGDGCGLRMFSPDGVHITRTLLGQANGALVEDMDNWAQPHYSRVASLPPKFRQAIATQCAVRGVNGYDDAAGDDSLIGIHYLVVPIRDSGRVYGLLTVARSPGKKDFDDFEVDLAQLLADRLGAFAHADSVRTQNAELSILHTHLGTRLQESEADRQALVVHLDETESRERLNLAGALHDEPLQLVVAALLRLDTWTTQADLDSEVTLKEIGNMLEESVEQLRTVISTLTPPDLSEGLGPAVRRLADATFFGTSTSVVVTGPNHVHLDPSTKESVYRIVREALINARKHAQAKHVVVGLVDTPERVQVRIADDGIGIGDPSSGSGHMGLPSMRARAEAAHAQLVISSNRGLGTVVELSLTAHNPNSPRAEIRRMQGMATTARTEHS